jgi:dTDP-4-dehydrorhamnose 3,5-epimerase-like enzyme
MYNTGMFKFKKISDMYGSLVPVEFDLEIPFSVKRIYYIFDVSEDMRRGFHSHKQLHQVLICVHGSVKIMLKTPQDEQIITLHNPTEGLYIGPMIWREMYDFTDNAVLLVLASEHYDEADYIRNFDLYIEQAIPYFEK